MKIVILMLISGIYLVLAFSVSEALVRAIFLSIAVWLFIWGYKEIKNEAERKEENERLEAERQLNQFSYTQFILSEDYLNAILIDETNEKLSIVSKDEEDEEFVETSFHFNEIYEVAIFEDDKVQKVIAKGGKEQNSFLKENENKVESQKNEEDEIFDEDEVKKLSMKFVVDDLTQPIVEYIFFERRKPISKTSEEYKEMMKVCYHWFQKMGIIIKRYEKVPVRQWGH